MSSSTVVPSLLELAIEAVKKVLGLIMQFRILITVGILVWGVFISKKIVDNSSEPRVDYVKYYNLHKIWFGEESLLVVLFKLWIYKLLLSLVIPTLLDTLNKSPRISSFLTNAQSRINRRG